MIWGAWYWMTSTFKINSECVPHVLEILAGPNKLQRFCPSPVPWSAWTPSRSWWRWCRWPRCPWWWWASEEGTWTGTRPAGPPWTPATSQSGLLVMSKRQPLQGPTSEVVLRYEPSTVYKLAGDTNLSSLAELLPKLAFICPKDQKLSLVISFRMW